MSEHNSVHKKERNRRSAEKRATGKREEEAEAAKGAEGESSKKVTRLRLSLRVLHLCVILEDRAGSELASVETDGLHLALALGLRGADELTLGLQIERAFFSDRRGGACRELVYCNKSGGSGARRKRNAGEKGEEEDGVDEGNEDGGDGGGEDTEGEEPAGVLLWVSLAPPPSSGASGAKTPRISLRVGNVGVSIVPDLAYEVFALLGEVGAKASKAFARRDKAGGCCRNSDAEEAQETPGPMELTLNTGHLLVLLTSPESELRCTVCGAHARYGRQGGSGELVGLVRGAEVFHSYELRGAAHVCGRKRGLGALRVTQALLTPFDVSVRATQKKLYPLSFFVGVTPVKATFSPQDVFRLAKLFSDAVDSLPKRTEASNAHNSNNSKHQHESKSENSFNVTTTTTTTTSYISFTAHFFLLSCRARYK